MILNKFPNLSGSLCPHESNEGLGLGELRTLCGQAVSFAMRGKLISGLRGTGCRGTWLSSLTHRAWDGGAGIAVSCQQTKACLLRQDAPHPGTEGLGHVWNHSPGLHYSEGLRVPGLQLENSPSAVERAAMPASGAQGLPGHSHANSPMAVRKSPAWSMGMFPSSS